MEETQPDHIEKAREIKKIPQFNEISSRQRQFLMAYVSCGSVIEAAKIAGCSWIAHYKWKESSQLYLKAFEKAVDISADFAEGDVYQRAFHGTDRPIWSKGQIIGSYKWKSDILAMFSLKKLRPEYRDNPQLAVNVNNAPPQITFNVLEISPVDKPVNSVNNADPLESLKQITSNDK